MAVAGLFKAWREVKEGGGSVIHDSLALLMTQKQRSHRVGEKNVPGNISALQVSPGVL